MERASFLRQVAQLSTNDTYGKLDVQVEAIIGTFDREEFLSVMMSKVIISCFLLRFVQTIYPEAVVQRFHNRTARVWLRLLLHHETAEMSPGEVGRV